MNIDKLNHSFAAATVLCHINYCAEQALEGDEYSNRDFFDLVLASLMGAEMNQ